ncbi:MAG: YicC family protein [Puniceicoccales bacterium]|jgi:uncharacterized protein (TIGR00255 family)|nr:YicC family protein [Puniceicoccales bacterium]
MPLKSMTGYGRAGFSLGGTEMTLEASAVNRRGLEISVSGPTEWTALERVVTGWVREHVARGKVTLNFQAQSGGENSALAWDATAVEESLKKLQRQALALSVPFTPDTALLLRLAELHRTRREGLPALDDAATQTILQTAVHTALGQLVAMRVSEGAFLAGDLLARIKILDTLLEQIVRHSTGLVTRYREALFARLQQAGLGLDLGDERVLKEVALFADRSDTAEEATRLRSHFEQFTACLEEKQEVGRKLDFLCQEMNRELNTIGSKANHLEITRCVIEGKNELERIREQVQNVE